MNNIKTHFVLIVMAYFFWGFGLATYILSDLSFKWKTGVFYFTLALFLTVVFTSLEKVKQFLESKSDNPKL